MNDDYSKRSVDSAVVHASPEEISASRPADLRDRVITYAAMLANNAYTATPNTIVYLAIIDELLTPEIENRTPFETDLTSPAIMAVIDDLLQEGRLVWPTHVEHDPECVTPIDLSSNAFHEGHRRRWTPWGFMMWQFMEGLFGEVASGKPRLCSFFFEDDLRDTLDCAEPTIAAWRENGGALRDHNKTPEIVSLIAKHRVEYLREQRYRRDELVEPYSTMAYFYARYIVVGVEKELGEKIGAKRYMRQRFEMAASSSFAPDGKAKQVRFFLDDREVGVARYTEVFKTRSWTSAKTGQSHSTQIEDHGIIGLQIAPEFIGTGYDEVVIRHLMTVNAYRVPKRLADKYPDLMLRHGRRNKRGGVRLSRVSWGKVKEA